MPFICELVNVVVNRGGLISRKLKYVIKYNYGLNTLLDPINILTT